MNSCLWHDAFPLFVCKYMGMMHAHTADHTSFIFPEWVYIVRWVAQSVISRIYNFYFLFLPQCDYLIEACGFGSIIICCLNSLINTKYSFCLEAGNVIVSSTLQPSQLQLVKFKSQHLSLILISFLPWNSI